MSPTHFSYLAAWNVWFQPKTEDGLRAGERVVFALKALEKELAENGWDQVLADFAEGKNLVRYPIPGTSAYVALARHFNASTNTHYVEVDLISPAVDEIELYD